MAHSQPGQEYAIAKRQTCPHSHDTSGRCPYIGLHSAHVGCRRRRTPMRRLLGRQPCRRADAGASSLVVRSVHTTLRRRKRKRSFRLLSCICGLLLGVRPGRGSSCRCSGSREGVDGEGLDDGHVGDGEALWHGQEDVPYSIVYTLLFSYYIIIILLEYYYH
jgi:hypothetical protein